MTDQASDQVIKDMKRHTIIDWAIVHGLGDPVFIGKPAKPASKPADPAFKNALRQRPMRIGLRYIGD
jgi:hypothetical protein